MKLTSIFLFACLSACSYQNQPPLVQSQYCFVDEIIIEESGKHKSKTVTTCSDKPRVEHFVKDVGIARDCKAFKQQYSFRGKRRYVEGFLCQFEDGTWQAVDGRYAY